MDEHIQLNDGVQDDARTRLAKSEQAHLLTMPSDEVDHTDLEELARADPAGYRLVVERIKKAARRELDRGYRATYAVEDVATPWEQAQFLALRESLIEDWQPATGIERMLIDTLAQAYTMRLRWLEILQTRLCAYGPAHEARKRRQDAGDQPRISVAAAIEQAAAMVDRFDRMIVRNIRALRDLRRYAGPVMIQHAGQVNVGAQQINTTGDMRADAPPASTTSRLPTVDHNEDD